ncbi:MAG: hypothetical protein MSS66_08585 [Selenomonadaceae bacterium]|nr:hypothetical protein [Selenomonadaceae bacterium]
MKNKLIILFGIMLIIFGGFGYGYTYMADHRTADSLSAYCDIDFKTDVDEKGKVSTANLTILDYRFAGDRLKPALLLICDDDIFDMQASIRQTPPSYSIAFYNDKTTFKNTNKLFAEFPADSFNAIRNAQVVRIRFTYEDGTSIELPLNEHDLQYWKDQLNK